MKERIREWDYLHGEKNLGALSGCTYEETVDFLRIKDLIDSVDTILEIGVGMGYVTAELYDRGYRVSAFDISRVGLQNVISLCDGVYDFDNIQSLPTNEFDLIICHNVVQHIPTPELYYEMFHFIRSLKPTGTMAVKSILATGIKDTGDDPDLTIGGIVCSRSIGCFCRSIDYFKKIVDRCGGVAELVWDENIAVDCITNQHVFHITKKYK